MGDALGMPTEFLSPDQIRELYGRIYRLTKPNPSHYHAHLPAGRITDDTGQALALLEAYLEHRQLTPDRVARHLLTWADHEPLYDHFVGPATRLALEKLRQGKDPSISGTAGKTNGAAMRAPVIGMMNPGNLDAAIMEAYIASLPTHGTNLAIAGAASVACAVAMAMTGNASIYEVVKAAEYGARCGQELGRKIVLGKSLEEQIQKAVRLVENCSGPKHGLMLLYEEVGAGMAVGESVAAAFGIVLLSQGNPTRAAMLSANLGGDTDTIGAISAAICGAWEGSKHINLRILRQIERVNRLDFENLVHRIEEMNS